MQETAQVRWQRLVRVLPLLLLLPTICRGWVTGTTTSNKIRQGLQSSKAGVLYSLATPPPPSWPASRSSRDSSTSSSSSSSSSHAAPLSRDYHHAEIDEEIRSGRILEGGQVVDFSSVRASSRVEEALAQARKALLQDLQQSGTHQPTNDLAQPSLLHAVRSTVVEPLLDERSKDQLGSTAILGINEDVIKEVGHPLGSFASPAEIQQCASFLRSKAPIGFLQNPISTADPSHTAVARNDIPQKYSSEQLQRFQEILNQAYVEAGEVTEAFAKTFYMGTMLLDEKERKAIWAVYVWCRRTDEIVDAPRDNENDMLRDLSSWELRLENLWTYGDVIDVFDLCMLDCRIQYPSLGITPFMDMIRGMLMDVPGLGQDRYERFDELHLYCYRVAGTVGLMSLPVFGCAPGYDDEVAREPALSLGVALQLTNILRDVGEDAVQRGRVYLPQEDLRRFGVTEDQIFEQRVDENYVELMKYEISRARMYYERARRGVFMLAPSSRLPVQSSLDCYGMILDKIEANGYDSLTKRAYVGKWEKLFTVPFSWYRTTELSRMLPLPGDKTVVLDAA